MKKAGRKRGLRPIRAFIVLLFLASSAIIILALPVWRIKQVTITGNRIISSGFIRQKASISLDENIFFINYREVTRRLSQIQQVKRARVSGQLPSTVIIKLEERKPFAVAIVGDDYIVVDDEGYIIDIVKVGEEKTSVTNGVTDLPTVLGLPADSIQGGKRIKPEIMEAIEKTFKLLSGLLKNSKFEIEMRHPDDINILINDILKVKIGTSQDIDKKLFNFSELLDQIGSRRPDVEYIDVRIVSDPVVRFKK